jgi:hypothetical protein
MSTELMKAFDFTEEDLAHNKAGKLSPRQLKRLKRASNRGRIVSFFVMLAFGIGAYFTLNPFLLDGLAIAGNVVRLVGGIILAGLSLFFLYAIFERDNPVIKSAQGKVQFVSRESDTPNEDGTVTSSTSYYVVIGNERFTINSGQYQFFNQGHIYAIYKEVSVLSRILSIEYIGPPES